MEERPETDLRGEDAHAAAAPGGGFGEEFAEAQEAPDRRRETPGRKGNSLAIISGFMEDQKSL